MTQEQERLYTEGQQLAKKMDVFRRTLRQLSAFGLSAISNMGGHDG